MFFFFNDFSNTQTPSDIEENLGDLLTKTYTKDFASSLRTRSKSLKQQITQLSKFLDSNQLVLVLGAGVSIEYGLPDWNTLLQRLHVSILSEGSNRIEQSDEVLATCFNLVFSPNPLTAARFLSNHFKESYPKKPLEFINNVQHSIYKGIKTSENSNLFKEIGKMCFPSNGISKLNSILTYNYDDILETYFTSLKKKKYFASIYKPGISPKQQELGIYHVHGFLPRSGALTEENQIILSEDLYHHRYNDVYNWSNLVQINKFKDNNCLFIGSSLSDPNLRRLLDISHSLRGDTNVHHYLLKKKYDNDYVEGQLRFHLRNRPDLLNRKNEAGMSLSETVEDLIKVVENFEENDARSFGVEIIWFDEHSEYATFLSQVRESSATKN